MRYFRYETLAEQDRAGGPDTVRIVEITKEEYNIRVGNRTHCEKCGRKKCSNKGRHCRSCHTRFEVNTHLAL